MPELSGSIVTIDAMGCQRSIAEQIIAQGGEYVLGLKGNQGSLQQNAADFFDVALAGNFAGVAHDVYEEIDKDHGRLEVRRYWITEDLRTLLDHSLWVGLRSIGLVQRCCTIATTESVERRSHHAVRGHWGVENRPHWRIDVLFREDASRIRKGNAPATMPAIRHQSLNLLEQEPSKLRIS